MRLPEKACLLRVFIGESDKLGSRPLYEAIVERARQEGLAGATVLRGFLGYGANSVIHTSKILRLSEDLPVVVEIVDSEEKVERFLSIIDPMIKEGMVTMEAARVMVYRHNGGKGK